MADSESERQRKVRAGREKLLQFQQRKKRKKEEGSNSNSPTVEQVSINHSNNNNSDNKSSSQSISNPIAISGDKSAQIDAHDIHADDTDNDLPSLASTASEFLSENGDSCSEYTSGEESYSYSTEDGHADSLAVAHLELNEYKNKIVELEENLNGKQSALKEVNKENFELRARLQMFETSKRQEITSSPVLKREIEDLHVTLRNKQRVLEDMNLENHDLRSRLSQKTEENNGEPAQMEELKFNLASKQTTLRELNRQNEDLTSDNTKLKIEIQEQTQLQRQQALEMNRLHALVEERDKDIEHLKAVITENTIVLDRLTAEVESHKDKGSEMELLIDRFKAEIEGLQGSKSDLLGENNKLKELLKKTEKKVNELEESLLESTEQFDSGTDYDLGLKAELDQKSSKIKELEYQVSMAIGERDALHLEAQTEAEEFREQIESLQRQIEEDNQMLLCHEESIDKASKDLAASVQQVLELQKSLKDERDNVVRLEVELLQQREGTEERIQRIKDSYNSDHSEVRNEVEAKDDQIEELRERYNDCLDELQTNRNSYDEKILRLESDIERLAREHEDEKEQMELVYNKDISDLKAEFASSVSAEESAAHTMLNNTIHDLKLKHDADVNAVMEKYNASSDELQLLRRNYEEKVLQLEEEHERTAKAHREEKEQMELVYNKEIADLRAEFANDVNAEENAAHAMLNNTIHDLKLKHDADVNAVMEKLTAKDNELEKYTEFLKEQETISTQLESQCSLLQNRLDAQNIEVEHCFKNTIPDLNRTIENLKQEIEQRNVAVEKASSSHAAASTLFAKHYGDLLSGLNALKNEKESISNFCVEQFAVFKQECLAKSQELNSMNVPLLSEKESELNACKIEMQQLKEECDDLKLDLDMREQRNEAKQLELQNLLSNKAEELEAVKRRLEDLSQVNQRTGTPDCSLMDESDGINVNSSAVEDLKVQLEHMKASHEKQMQQLQADFESDLRFLEEENERLGGEIVTLNDQYEKSKHQILDSKTKECEEIVERCRSESTAMQDEWRSALETEQEERRQKHEEQLAQLREQHEADLKERLSGLQQQKDAELVEIKETLMQQRNADMTELSSQLLHEKEMTIVQLKQEMEAELHGVRKEKQMELTALQSQMQDNMRTSTADSNEALLCQVESLQAKCSQNEDELRQKDNALREYGTERDSCRDTIVLMQNVTKEAIGRLSGFEFERDTLSGDVGSLKSRIDDLMTNERLSADWASTVSEAMAIVASELRERTALVDTFKKAKSDAEQQRDQLESSNQQMTKTVADQCKAIEEISLLQTNTEQNKRDIEKVLAELQVEKQKLAKRLEVSGLKLEVSFDKQKAIECKLLAAEKQLQERGDLSHNEDDDKAAGVVCDLAAPVVVEQIVMSPDNEQVEAAADLGSITISPPSRTEENLSSTNHDIVSQVKRLEDLLLEHRTREEESKTEIERLKTTVEQEHEAFTRQLSDERTKRQQLEKQLEEFGTKHEKDVTKATEALQERLDDVTRREIEVENENKRLLDLIEQNSVESIKEKSMLQMEIMQQEETIQGLRDKMMTSSVVTSDLQDLFSRQLAHLETQRDALLEQLEGRKSTQRNYADMIHENASLTSSHRKEKQGMLDKLREKDKLEESLHTEKSLLQEKLIQLEKLRESLLYKERLEKELLVQKNALQGELEAVENNLLLKEETLFREKTQLESELRNKDRILSNWEESVSHRERTLSRRTERMRQNYAAQLESTRHELERTHEQSMRRLQSDIANGAQKRVKSMEDILHSRYGHELSSIRSDYNEQLEDWYQLCEWLFETTTRLPCFKSDEDSGILDVLKDLRIRLTMARRSTLSPDPQMDHGARHSDDEEQWKSDSTWSDDEDAGKCLRLMYEQEMEDVQVEMLVDATIRLEACRIQNEIESRQKLSALKLSLDRDLTSIERSISDERPPVSVVENDDTEQTIDSGIVRHMDTSVTFVTPRSDDRSISAASLTSDSDFHVTAERQESLSDHNTSRSRQSSESVSEADRGLEDLRKEKSVLENELSKCRKEITNVRDEMDGLREGLLKEQVDSFGRMKKSFEVQKNALLWSFASEKTMLQCNFDERIHVLNDDHAREIEELKRLYEKGMEERDSKANEDVEKMKAELAARYQDAERQHRQEIETQFEEHKTTIEEERQKADGELRRVVAELGGRCEADLKHVTSRLDETHATEIDSVKGNLIVKYEQNLNELESKLEKEKTKLNAEAVVKIKEEHAKEMEVERAKMEVKHAVMIAAMKQKFKDKHSRQKEMLRLRMSREFEENSKWQASLIEELQEKHEIAVSGLRRKLDAEFQVTVSDLRERHEKEVEEMRLKIDRLQAMTANNAVSDHDSNAAGGYSGRSSCSSNEFDARVTAYVNDVIQSALTHVALQTADTSISKDATLEDGTMAFSDSSSIDSGSSCNVKLHHCVECTALKLRIETLKSENENLQRELTLLTAVSMETKLEEIPPGDSSLSTTSSCSEHPSGDANLREFEEVDGLHRRRQKLTILSEKTACESSKYDSEMDPELSDEKPEVDYTLSNASDGMQLSAKEEPMILLKEHDDALQRQKEIFEERISSAKASLKQDMTAQMQSALEKCSKEVEARMEAAHNAASSAAKEDYERRIESLKMNHSKEIEQIRLEHESTLQDEISAVSLSMEEEIQKIRLELDSAHREEMDAIKSKLLRASAKIVALEALNAGIESTCEEEISTLKTTCASDIDQLKDDLEKSYSQDIETLQAEWLTQSQITVEEMGTALEQQKSEMNSHCEKRLKAMRDELTKETEQQHRDHEQTLEEKCRHLGEEHEEEKAQLTRNIAKIKEEAEKSRLKSVDANILCEQLRSENAALKEQINRMESHYAAIASRNDQEQQEGSTKISAANLEISKLQEERTELQAANQEMNRLILHALKITLATEESISKQVDEMIAQHSAMDSEHPAVDQSGAEGDAQPQLQESFAYWLDVRSRKGPEADVMSPLLSGSSLAVSDQELVTEACSRLGVAVEQLLATVSLTSKQLSEARQAYDQSSIEAIEQKQQVNALEETRDDTARHIERLTSESRELRLDLDAANASLAAHTEESKALRDGLRDAKSAAKGNDERLREAEDHIMELREDNQLLADAKRSLEMRLAQLRTSVEDDRFARQQSQNRLSSSSSPQVDSRAEEMKIEMDEMKEIIENLHQAKIDLENKVSDMANDRTLLDEKEKLNRVLAETTEQNNELLHENGILRVQMNNLESEMAAFLPRKEHMRLLSDRSRCNADDTEETFLGENYPLPDSILDSCHDDSRRDNVESLAKDLQDSLTRESQLQEKIITLERLLQSCSQKTSLAATTMASDDESGNGTMELEAVLAREQGMLADIRNMQETIESLKTNNELLSSALEAKTTVESELTNQVRELEAQATRQRRTYSDNDESAQEQVNRLTDDNKRLLESLDEANRLRGVTEKNLKDKSAECDQLKIEVEHFEPLRETVKKLEQGLKDKDVVLDEMKEKNLSAEELLQTKEQEMNRINVEFSRLEGTKIEQQHLLESQHKRILELIERQGTLESKSEYINELEQLVAEAQALADLKEAQMEALKARSRQNTPSTDADRTTGSVKMEDLQNKVIALEKENVRLSAVVDQQTNEITHLRQSQTDAVEHVTRELAKQHEINTRRLQKQHQDEMEKLLEISRIDGSSGAELERRVDDVLGATEQIDKRMMEHFLRRRSSVAAQILTPKIEGRNAGQTIVQTLLNDLQAEAEEISNLILEYPSLDETVDAATIKSLQRAWSAEKQSLLNAVKSLKDLVAKTSHTVLVGSATDSETDWRAEMLGCVQKVFSRENDVLKSELETLRLLAGAKHVAPKMIEEAAKQITMHGQVMDDAMADLREKDRESLLAELRSLNALLSHTQRALDEYQASAASSRSDDVTKQDSQLTVRLRNEIEEERDKVSELTRQLNRERRALDDSKDIDAANQLKIKELQETMNNDKKEAMQLRSLCQTEKQRVADLEEMLTSEQRRLRTIEKLHDVDRQNNDASHLRVTVDELERTLKHERQRCDSLTQRCDRLEEYERAYEEAKRTAKVNDQTLHAERAERQKLESVAERYHSSLEELKSMFATERKKRSELERRCQVLEDGKLENEQLVALSRTEKERAKDALAEERRLKTDAQHALQLAEIKLATYKSEIDSRSTMTPADVAADQRRFQEVSRALQEEKSKVTELKSQVSVNTKASSEQLEQEQRRCRMLEENLKSMQLVASLSSVPLPKQQSQLHDPEQLNTRITKLEGEKLELRSTLTALENEVMLYRNRENDIEKAAKRCLAEEQLQWKSENAALQDALSKVNAELAATQSGSNKLIVEVPKKTIDNGWTVLRIQRLYARYLRAESFRKSLCYQKRYLLHLLGGFHSTESVVLASIAKMNSSQFVAQIKPEKRSVLTRFRGAVRLVIAIHRLGFLVKKRQRSVLRLFSLPADKQQQQRDNRLPLPSATSSSVPSSQGSSSSSANGSPLAEKAKARSAMEYGSAEMQQKLTAVTRERASSADLATKSIPNSKRSLFPRNEKRKPRTIKHSASAGEMRSTGRVTSSVSTRSDDNRVPVRASRAYDQLYSHNDDSPPRAYPRPMSPARNSYTHPDSPPVRDDDRIVDSYGRTVYAGTQDNLRFETSPTTNDEDNAALTAYIKRLESLQERLKSGKVGASVVNGRSNVHF